MLPILLLLILLYHGIVKQDISVQLLSHVQLFATPWTAAYQASLSITRSQSLLKLMSIESVMPSNHLILCRPLLLLPSIFPSIRVFFNDSVIHITGGQNIGVSASISVLSMNIQDWFPLGWTDWISLQSKGLSRIHTFNFSSSLQRGLYHFTYTGSSLEHYLLFPPSHLLHYLYYTFYI